MSLISCFVIMRVMSREGFRPVFPMLCPDLASFGHSAASGKTRPRPGNPLACDPASDRAQDRGLP